MNYKEHWFRNWKPRNFNPTPLGQRWYDNGWGATTTMHAFNSYDQLDSPTDLRLQLLRAELSEMKKQKEIAKLQSEIDRMKASGLGQQEQDDSKPTA